MRLQGSSMIQPVPIWGVLQRIEKTLGIGPKQMAVLLRLKQATYEDYEQERHEPSVGSLMHLAEHLNISFEALMTNSFCYRTLARHFTGDKAYVPEKYIVAGKSKRRILANLLDYVESETDWARRIELMQYLQISEAALADPEGTINLQCTIEAVEWLYRQYRSEGFLEKMGREMLLAPHYNLLKEELKDTKSLYDLFDSIFFESGVLFKHLEKNFIWTIQKRVPGDRILVRGTVNEEIMGQVSQKHVRSHAGFLVRKGILSTMPNFLGLGAAPARITDFFSSRKNSCDMEIDISQIIRTQPRRSMDLVR